ncbi:hypothetical protein EZY14_013845 [Kordia sp. TARA_039_SRF]|nr:hypothetical protein EZY14_013845 [Kordia sp. TARA_039_SRF]
MYKTPSGARYHLSSCRMVENVSKKLSGVAEINAAKLTPWKICKPPSISQLKKGNSFTDKSVGTATSVRCKHYTKRNTLQTLHKIGKRLLFSTHKTRK